MQDRPEGETIKLLKDGKYKRHGNPKPKGLKESDSGAFLQGQTTFATTETRDMGLAEEALLFSLKK